MFVFCFQTLSENRRLGFPGIINGCLNFMPVTASRLYTLAANSDNTPGDTEENHLSEKDREIEIVELQKKIDKPWEIMAKHC